MRGRSVGGEGGADGLVGEADVEEAGVVGEDRVRDQFEEGHHDESSFVHAGVGDGEAVVVDGQAVDQEDVDVDGSGAPADVSGAAERRFDAVERRRGGRGARGRCRSRRRRSGSRAARGRRRDRSPRPGTCVGPRCPVRRRAGRSRVGAWRAGRRGWSPTRGRRPSTRYRSGAVAAAATPSMPKRSAAFGLWTTAVTRVDAFEPQEVVRDRGGHRFDQVERALLDDRPDRLGDAAIVGGARDVVVADVHLDVQVDDEVLRFVLLTRTRAVTAGRTDAR